MPDHDHAIEGEPVYWHRPPAKQKGRGATTNLQGRHEVYHRDAFYDGWDNGANSSLDDPMQPKTQVFDEYAKTILTRNRSPDIPFSVSLNPYRGCEHGCVYCFARPTHSYLGLSPGLDFETKVFAKVNAPELLRHEISRSAYVPEPIALGVNTDAYQPCERDLRLTRRVLEILCAADHPVALITKASLIERDIDLLASMAAKRLAAVAITITTLDPGVARALEPRATAPARRLRTIRALTDAGIPVGVSIAPVIPFVTEPDLERVMEAAVDAGAISASYIVLRLPWEVSPIFQQWLEAHFPDRARRVMNRIQEMRGGKDYEAEFGKRMRGEGVWADLILQRFEKAKARLGMTAHARDFAALDMSQFRRPEKRPHESRSEAMPSKRMEGQLDLF